MRNQWRFLLRHNLLSSPRFTRSLFQHQVSSSSSAVAAVVVPFSSTFETSTLIQSHHFHRFYSSSTACNSKLPETSVVIDIFSKPLNHDEIINELNSNNVIITLDLVVEALKHLSSEPATAFKLFNWVTGQDIYKKLLDSNAYNLMLGTLGGHGYVEEFWVMVDVMKEKGFGIKRAVFDRTLETFKKDGLQADIEKLHGLFVKKTTPEVLSRRINRIVRRSPWDESSENDLKALDISYSTEFVKMVLEKLAFEPLKGLNFFRWLEDSGVFKHDQTTYNVMVVVLGREDCIDRFWSVVEDMRKAGYEMESKTYFKVLTRFIERKMTKDAVALFEFAMNGANKPSREDCVFLLKKLAVAPKLDMELFSRVVKGFTEKGFALDDAMLDSALKSLSSVGRMKECKKVLDAMVEAGYAPSGSMKARVAYDLSSSKLKNEADEFMENLEGHGLPPDYKTCSSLIEGHCVAGDFDKAKDCLEKMVEKEEVRYIGYSLDMLVNAYCDRFRAAEACKLLTDLVNNKPKIEPWHATYKTLLTKLLSQRGFKDSLPLLALMKSHGFPPYVDPFMLYLSKKGSAEDALQFFKAMTVKRYPANDIYIRLFEAYSKSGRHEQAQNLLAKCPQHIRNHADVLDIFCRMKAKKPAETKLSTLAA